MYLRIATRSDFRASRPVEGSSDQSNGLRYHSFDTRSDTEFNLFVITRFGDMCGPCVKVIAVACGWRHTIAIAGRGGASDQAPDPAPTPRVCMSIHPVSHAPMSVRQHVLNDPIAGRDSDVYTWGRGNNGQLGGAVQLKAALESNWY
jgi:alpha-tubulin suppressor-like RCC1 family protein